MAASCPKFKLSDGNEIPAIGLGTWKSNADEGYKAVCRAIDIGYRHLDCALVYENEAEIGRAIRDKIKEGVVTRQDLFVTSKCWNTYRSSFERVQEGLEKSLRDLGLDYLDLYLIHWPFSYAEDGGLTPLDEHGRARGSDADFMTAWHAMVKLQKMGKIRSIGVSNFNSEQISRVLAESSVPPVTNQVENNPYLQQEKLRAFCAEKGIVLTAYGPLGSPYKPETRLASIALKEPRLLDHPVLTEIGKAHGKSAAQVMLRFQIQRGLPVIPKSSNPERIAHNFQLFDFELSRADMDRITQLDKGIRIVTMESAKHLKHYPFNTEF